MNSKTILGVIVATVFAVSMISLSYADVNPGSLTVTSASQDSEGTYSMDLVGKVKEFNAKDAPDLVTFWAWLTEEGGGDVNVVAITLHHKVNDHQAFDPVFCAGDKNPTCKPIKSNPVQSFHPHYAEFTFTDHDDDVSTDDVLCVTNLVSPNLDFRVHNQDTITVEDSSTTYAGFYATGTIGAINGCPVGLGITSVISTNLP